MSKALLVIELDDEWLDRINTTCDEMLADVTLYKKESLEKQCDYLKKIYRCWSPLKSMPEKKSLSEEVPSITFIDGKAVDRYTLGWNDCVECILGEEE